MTTSVRGVTPVNEGRHRGVLYSTRAVEPPVSARSYLMREVYR